MSQASREIEKEELGLELLKLKLEEQKLDIERKKVEVELIKLHYQRYSAQQEPWTKLENSLMPEMKKYNVEVRSDEDAKQALEQQMEDLKAGLSSDVSMHPSPEYVRCDFCSLRPVEWTYPCQDFVGVEVIIPMDEGPVAHTQTSRGNRAACNACRDLIEDGRIEDLKRRMSEIQGFTGDQFMESIVFGQLQGFFEHRTGPAYKEK